MRIVQVMTDLRTSGAERVVTDLSLGLLARGHQVGVVGLLPEPDASPAVDELRAAGIPVHSIELSKLSPWRLRRLAPLLDRFRPDLVHAHLFHAEMAARLARKNRPWKLVCTIHVAERRRSRAWQFPLDRWTGSRVDLRTAVSSAARDYHAGRIGISPARFPVIINGVRPPHHPSAEEIARLHAEWEVSDCEVVMGSVGRLHPQKGFARLLGLLPDIARLVPEGHSWGLVILGDGPERRHLERLAARAPASIRISLPGFRADAARCIGAFDIFLMPSLYEGLPLAFVEAMAQGVPAVVSPVDSFPELAGYHPVTRIVDFAPGNGSAVASAVSDLLRPGSPADPRLPFTVDAMVEGYLRLYRQLLEGRK